MTDVTIRGIDDEIYRRFSAEARNKGISIGKLVTVAMNNLLDEKSMENYVIEKIKEVNASKKDIESLEKPVIFKNINKLTFSDDVDWPTFRDYVKEIKNVRELNVPNKLNELQILAKSKSVAKINRK